MKSKFILLILLFLLVNPAWAQTSNLFQYGSHFSTPGARLNPTRLGEGVNSVNLYIAPFFNAHVWTGNNFINTRDLIDILGDDIPIDDQNSSISEAIDQIDQKNALRYGASLQPIALAIKFKRKDDPERELFYPIF